MISRHVINLAVWSRRQEIFPKNVYSLPLFFPPFFSFLCSFYLSFLFRTKLMLYSGNDWCQVCFSSKVFLGVCFMLREAQICSLTLECQLHVRMFCFSHPAPNSKGLTRSWPLSPLWWWGCVSCCQNLCTLLLGEEGLENNLSGGLGPVFHPVSYGQRCPLTGQLAGVLLFYQDRNHK